MSSRRIGMTLKPWHRTWHNVLMSDPAYQSLTAENIGVYHFLRNCAGQRWNCGSLSFGAKDNLNRRQVIELVSDRVRGMNKRRAAAAVNWLIDRAGLLAERKVRRRGVVMCIVVIARWRQEQSCQFSPGAVRVQRWREAQRVGEGLAGPTGPGGQEPEPAGDQGSRAADLAERGRVAAEIRRSLTAAAAKADAAAGAGGPRNLVVWAGSFDPYDGDPLELAKDLSGERGRWSVDGFKVALGKVGEGIFRAGMKEIRRRVLEGQRPKRTMGAWLHSAISEIAAESGVPAPADRASADEDDAGEGGL